MPGTDFGEELIRAKDYRYEKNCSVLLVSKSGLSESLVDSTDPDYFTRAYFFTDSEGTTRDETGYVFAEHGYKIKEFNLASPDASVGYNPIKYIRTEEDVMSFATCLIKNTTPSDTAKSEDYFWELTEKQLYQAIIEYMRTEVPVEDRNLVTLCEILDLGHVNPKFATTSALDILYSELEASQPNHPAVIAYRLFKTTPLETQQSILVSCRIRLAPLRPKKIQRILARDEMELDKFGEEKIACYAVMSANDPTYNFLFAMMIWQLFDVLLKQRFIEYSDRNGAPPVGVDFLLDEFANYYIPNFERMICVLRSCNIRAHIGVRSKSQLKDKYGKENARGIINNCAILMPSYTTQTSPNTTPKRRGRPPVEGNRGARRRDNRLGSLDLRTRGKVWMHEKQHLQNQERTPASENELGGQSYARSRFRR